MSVRTDNVNVVMRISPNSIRRNAALWLRQGISPRRLALTLALGFAIGCIPMVGIPTLVCAILALTLKLNLPAIQAANYVVMPLQIVLIAPFIRLGGWLFSSAPRQDLVASLLRSPLTLPPHLLSQMASITEHAMMAWLLIATPAVALMTFSLTLVLRRIPAVAVAEAGN
jgi:uncharacterized protein (DUF2062 family)